MNIYITLDYELFFGEKSGSVEKCIIEPTNDLLRILDPYAVKAVFFVDAGYLYALKRQKEEHPQLQKDYAKISEQIKQLSKNEHGLELHIHPHWEDTFFSEDKGWIMNTSRYKIDDFSENKAIDIFDRYHNALAEISGKKAKAYRAGGWSAQPFSKIDNALRKQEIFIDSTVYPKGYYLSENQYFDFTNVPQYKTKYSFSKDLTIEDGEGPFTETPISSLRVSPVFFWKFALVKILKMKQHKAYGDGFAIKMEKHNIFKLLLKPSHTVISIDGYKASLIKKGIKRYRKNTNNQGNFVLIGHPKAFTKYSLTKVGQFVREYITTDNFTTF